MRGKYVALGGLSLILLASQWPGQASGTSSAASPSRREEPARLGDVRFGVVGDGTGRVVRPTVERRPAANAHNVGMAIVKSGQSGATLPLAVDGEKNPERIPDYVAYRHFLSVTAVDAAASARDVARRDAFVAQLQLSSRDRAAYLAALDGVREQLASIEQQRRQLNHGADASALGDLKAQQGQVLDAAAARAMASLSVGGAEQLRRHINGRVKRHIKIYGEPLQ